jgi:nucleoside phosphorylase
VTGGAVDLADALFVVGMEREARILSPQRRVVVGTRGLASAIATQRPGAVISFGLCGALSSTLACGDVVMATRVVDRGDSVEADQALRDRLLERFSRAVSGPVVGSATIVGQAQEKAALALATGAIAVDMESAQVARAATAAGLPFAVVRAVSDRAADTLPRAAQAGFGPEGAVDILAVILGLVRRPWELAPLIATARSAGAGFKALAAVSRSLDSAG